MAGPIARAEPAPSPSPRLYLLAGTPIDLAALRLMLRDELQCEPAMESSFAPVAIWDAMRLKPTLALVVSDRPYPEVCEAARMIPRLHPGTRVLVLSRMFDFMQIRAWSSCPLDGFVLKDGGLPELRQALEALFAGQPYFSAGVREHLVRSERSRDGRRPLSRRESELLPLLANGMTLREAAASMTVSYKTADAYRTSLLRKLGVRDRVELARYAIRERIIEA